MAVSISSIFGGGSASSIFSAGLSGAASDAQVVAQEVVNANKTEINRIRGYKIKLTPADNQRLTEIQKEITKINSKVSNGTIRADEFEDRSELFLEADTILGKPSAGVENDDFLDDIREKIDAVLAPRLNPRQENRIATLTTLKEAFQSRLDDDPSNVIAIRQIQNVQRQIDTIDVPRQVSQLSVSEKLEYDDLVDQANEHAGAKLLLNSRDSVRVQQLQESINNLSGLLPTDAANQPSAAAVSRAYTRLAF